MSRHLLATLATTTVAAAALTLTACTPGAEGDTTDTRTGAADTTTASADVWDQDTLHSFEVDVDPEDYAELMDAYVDDGEKTWITATVTIDGVTFEDAGLKLKGNSSLRGASADSDPADLPWIIRLDKFVDQDLDGATEFAIRANSSATSLNEAVALDLLDAAGLAAQEAVAASFTFEDSEPTLRLVVENPDDSWMERELGDGYLYKAEAGGDYSYRGEDAAAYDGVFDQEGGDDDLAPLIDFLDFLDTSDDATFAAELPQRLDVDAFATYLAYQEIVDNDDDIDGPGNNSYLYYDPDTALMTVVNWDLNLAFGATPGTGGGAAPGAGGGMPGGAPGGRDDARPDPRGETPSRAGQGETGQAETGQGPAGQDAGAPTARQGGPSSGNLLAERFLANDGFAALVDAELERLTDLIYVGGLADESLAEWTDLLLSDATGLVDADTIRQESDSLAGRFAE